jgi:hypothetical protein
MKTMNQNEIPVLPVQVVVDDECVAFGVGDDGAIIQFIDRDKCILLEWLDVIRFGAHLLKLRENPTNEPEEIAAPTVDT